MTLYPYIAIAIGIILLVVGLGVRSTDERSKRKRIILITVGCSITLFQLLEIRKLHVNTHLFGVFACVLGLSGVLLEMRSRKKRNEKVPRSVVVFAVGATILAILSGIAFLLNI
jgi:hypothetical protein